MPKINLSGIVSGFNLSKINDNFTKIADALNNKVLYRDNPVGENNSVNTDVDMNGRRLYNLPTPVQDSEPMRLQDIKNIILGNNLGATPSLINQSTVIATAGQTVVVTPGYTVGSKGLEVFKNGKRLLPVTEYTETSTTSITLITPAVLGDVIYVRAFQFIAFGGIDATSVSANDNAGGSNFTTLQQGLDYLQTQLSDYAALRSYTGKSKSIYITGYSVTTAPSGISGWFICDDLDTGSLDDGATIIVNVNNKRFKRVFTGPPNILWWGAIGDNATINTSVFTTIEASSFPSFYVPNGSFLSGLSILNKNYSGIGSVVTIGGLSNSGSSRSEMLKKTSGLSSSNALLFSGKIRAVTFIGDSITAGDGASTPSRKYAAVLQGLLNSSGINTQSSFLSGGMLTRSTTPVAPFAIGSKGVGKQSIILNVGGKLTFSADYVDTVLVRYIRTPSSGTLGLTSNGASIGTLPTSGTAQDDVLGVLTTTARGNTSVNYEIVCSGSPVEITGVYAYRSLVNATSQPFFINFQAFSGYNTNNFNDTAAINSLIAQCPTPEFNFGVYVLAIGTNDIYNVTTANTSANYKSNLEGIITKIRAGTSTSCSIVLTVPLNSTGTYANPILEPFDNYRNAVYELGRKYDLQVVDLSEINLTTIGGFADGIHPNDYGHSILASFWYDKLFGNLSLKNSSDNLSLVAPVVLQSGSQTCTMIRGGVVHLSGSYQVTSVAKLAQIASVPLQYAPLTTKIFSVPCWGGGGSPAAGSAIVTVNPGGGITLFDYSPPNISYIALDGISYTSLT